MNFKHITKTTKFSIGLFLLCVVVWTIGQVVRSQELLDWSLPFVIVALIMFFSERIPEVHSKGNNKDKQ